MKKLISALAGVAIIASLSGGAYAATMSKSTFSAMDTNHNGKISASERAAYTKKVAMHKKIIGEPATNGTGHQVESLTAPGQGNTPGGGGTTNGAGNGKM